MRDVTPTPRKMTSSSTGHAKRKACDAIHQSGKGSCLFRRLLQQVGSGVSDLRLIADISEGPRHAEADDARHSVERSSAVSPQENVERREAEPLATGFHVELPAPTRQ